MSASSTAPPYLRGLDERQRAAVLADTERPLAVVASAGSGKTGVITRRVQHLLALGVPPARVLVVTFTKGAAEEMAGRLEADIGRVSARSVVIRTFHSLSLSLCRAHAHLAGRANDFAVWTERQQLVAVRHALTEARVALSCSDGDPAPPTLRADATDPERMLTSIMRSKALGPSRAARPDELTARVLARYDAILREANALDMHDFLHVAAAALDASPTLRAQLNGAHSHLLVDECQDTSEPQLRLLALLASHGRITLVGDDDQAIYGFRGAVGLFAQLLHAFPSATLVTLERNFRSTATIVAAAAALRRTSAAITDAPAGEPVVVAECRTAADEARLIVDGVKAHVAAGGSPRDVAVLFRSARAGAQLQAALAAARLPFNSHAPSLWETKPVRDLTATLTLLVSPHDDDAFERMLRALAPKHAPELLARLGGGRSRRPGLRAAAERLVGPAEGRAGPLGVLRADSRGNAARGAIVSPASSASRDAAPPAKRQRAGGGGAAASPLTSAQLSALRRALDTIGTLGRRLPTLTLAGLLTRAADAIPCNGAFRRPPPTRAGSALLNTALHDEAPADAARAGAARADAGRTLLDRVLETSREIGREVDREVDHQTAPPAEASRADGPISDAELASLDLDALVASHARGASRAAGGAASACAAGTERACRERLVRSLITPGS